MDKEIIYGNRIYLRPITDADTDMVLSWRNCARTVHNFYYKKPITAEEHTNWLRTKVDTGEVWQYVVCLKDSGTPIGSVYLQHFDTATLTGESGVFFSEDAPSGQGYATEAVTLVGEKVGFDKLGLLHLTAKVISENEASRRVHEKSGFRLARTIRGDSCSDGTTVDSLWYVKDVPAYKTDRKPILKAHTGHIHEKEDGSLLISVPGSKSITNRAFLTAMLAEGESVLKGVLFSDDTESFLSCMEELGIKTETDRSACTIKVHGCGGNIPNKEAHLNVGSAGTAARFLTAVLGLCKEGIYHLDSSEQMKKRPMAPLLDSLKELGCEVIYEGEEGFFPFTLKPHGFGRNEISVDISKSSQFLSALLIAAPVSDNGLKVNVIGTHGLSYVEMTRRIMRSFGIDSNSDGRQYTIPSGTYKAVEYSIEPDASAAAYFIAMSPLIKRPVTIEGLYKDSMQGDTGFADTLEQIGWINAVFTSDGINITPGVGLSISKQTSDLSVSMRTSDISDSKQVSDDAITVNMSSCSDQTITLAAIAPFLNATLRITGISHIRLQESDRITAIVSELKKMGIRAFEDGDDIVINPGTPSEAQISTYNDHRMAMGFSLAGLTGTSLTILNPMCCSKTFPDYFAYLDEILNVVKKS